MKHCAISRLALAAVMLTFAERAQSQLAAAPANAAQGQGIEDIVVTATRMGETRLQSTPLAVTALNGAQLNERGVRDVQDLKTFVPSLQVSDFGGYSQLYIRGVGSNIVFIGSDPSTTINLDGVYLARPLSYLNNFLDVDRVEVLRGPQGTLYGRNSVGGTINVISRRPSETFQGEVQGEFGTFDRYGIAGYASGPITKGGILASLAFDVSGNEGYLENVSTGGDLEGMKSRGVRGQVLVPVGASGEWTVRADYSRQSGALGIYPKLLGPDASPLDNSVLGDYDKVSVDGKDSTILKNYGVASDFKIGLGSFGSLRSLTSYRGFRGSIVTDPDGSSLPLFRNSIDPIRQNQFSQELTLNGKAGKLDYVIGAYYFSETDREPQTFNLLFAGVSHVQRPILHSQSVAGYGQGEYHLTNTVSLVAGLRYTTETKHYQLDDYYVASIDPNPAVAAAGPVLSGIPGISNPFTVNTRRHDHAFTPKFGINFKPVDTVLLYASATRGFKSGGYDYGASNEIDAATGYGPEKLWSYEVGIKSDWFDRKLRLNLDGFYYDYTDLQVESLVQNGLSFGARTQNAATAHVKGIEAEIAVKPVRALDLFANLDYLDARYVKYSNASITSDPDFDASGNRLNNAPRWSTTFGGTYTFDLGSSGKIFVGSDVHVQSTVYFTAANDGASGVTNYPEQQHGYTLIDARIGWTSDKGDWTVSVSGTNLGDRQYLTGTANYAAGLTSFTGRPGRPREVFGQITRKF
jgi:iron complex outermembrane receptor protein